jgi:CubicO group peptidase (beta-lactamase class C family)
MRTSPQIRTTFAAALVAMLAMAALHGSAGSPMLRATPEAVGMSSERLQMATAVLRQAVADRRLAGGVAAVARRGKLVYLEPFGVQSLSSKTPMSDRSLFRIYSMTKAVTSVAVMMLVESNQLQLSDAVSKYLPEFRNVMVQDGATGALRRPSRAITIRDLLLHTSGLNHRTSELYRRLQVRSRSIGLPQFVVNITTAPLLEDPGTRYRYSEGTTVLGRIVEVIARQPFDAFVTTRILQPLGMNDTSFWVEGDAQARLTTVYQRDGDEPMKPVEVEEVPFTEKPALIEGAVGLVSTAEDFVRFSQVLLNKGELNGVRLLKTETVASMTVNALPDAILQGKGGNVGWGLGNVDVVVGPGSRGYLTSIGEYGWDGSIGTFFSIDPAKELIVTLMTQNIPANPQNIRQRFKFAVIQSVVE